MEFDEIYKVYWPKVYRQCMGYVNDSALAKDMAQETFIKIWQHLDGFRNEASLNTWVFRIAANTCLGQIRRGKKMPKVELPSSMATEKPPNIEAEVQFLYQCISSLAEIERLIIALELEDINQKEIAEIVGISEANVRVKIHRIKKKLHQKFMTYER